MRQIVLDTETTGMDAHQGDRIIEIGCIELVNREPTGNNLHLYFNPERESDPGALAVHGLTTEFLSQFNTFEQHAQEIADYLSGAELLIHNAAFDVGFLNAEFARYQIPALEEIAAKITDTLALARAKFPGQRNSLDALCDRLGVSNEHRVLHGALLDAELLADVWLAMTREQFGLLDALQDEPQIQAADAVVAAPVVGSFSLPIIRADAEELAEHAAYVEVLDKAVEGESLWHRFK
ncbi:MULTISPECIES: DNA polymerase III subunit epsilon [Oligella]|uniref:DNA polymerase III subunit epsilon n=2 Tax=Oligella urethralis TaxID=90245 RepID=A0A096AN45_9BURK|nr:MULTISPECIES: DNA polymerase III subunit epsilon [Oligella]KGF32057.1 DNA polymerase III subunit epsilon [Oligella urethralis DNF00040]OFS83792.1 DNA polymerase III subunit epsilon [Oligella sp. HMSC05A10]OFV49298.1 DNA polymerase III subunit epsilon [Oligella sp. HMSC09E12]WOS37006.1 DNA polymerase III subunit epsilon [Oligella urethralis]SPY09071.1 DNA polymerase III subunit epsilon [Oligella urethralis]